MKATLDHNVVIDFANHSQNVERLRELLSHGSVEAQVVEIGASEMRARGIRPDRYDLFEDLLREAGLESVPRLMPLMIWDVTFWDHGIWAGKDSEAQLSRIESILFGDAQPPEAGGKGWLNRLCDVHTMWCHLHYKNDTFVTSDRNFHKATKKPTLIALGAGSILLPEEI